MESEGVVYLHEYAAILKRRKWWVAGAVLVAVGAAVSFSASRPATFSAQSQVLVQPSQFSSGLSRSNLTVNPITEVSVARSVAVAALARTTAHVSDSPETLLQNLSVQNPQDSQVLVFTYSDQDAVRAARLSQSFAQSYLQYKRDQAERDIVSTSASIQKEIAHLQLQVADATKIITSAPPNSPAYQNARAKRTALNDQIKALRAQYASVSTVSPDQGEVISPAAVPTSPSGPGRLQALALGLLFGLLLGVMAAFVRDRTDNRLGSRADAEAVLGAPVLASVPRDPRPAAAADSVPATIEDPRGPVAEGFRALRTGILAMRKTKDARILVVTSALPREGKTTSVANLAVALAQSGSTTLMVSADIRKPRLHELFDLPQGPGLAEVLAEGARLTEVCRPTDVKDLYFLGSGMDSVDTFEEVDFLQSPRMRLVLEEARSEFEFVVIDSPPVLVVADALALATLSDYVLFVVNARRARREPALEAREQLEHVGLRNWGVLLNEATDVRSGSYHYSRYGYGSRPRGLPGLLARLPVGSDSSTGS